MISNTTKEMVWTLYEMDKMSKTQIAKKLGISRQKVYDILADENNKNRHLQDIYKEYKIETQESLLKGLKEDPRTKRALDSILSLLDEEGTIKTELDKPNGLRSIMGAMKIIVETNKSALSSEYEHRRLLALEKQVKLKEQELELRQSNPEAFAQDIVIVNDIDDAKQYYEKDKNGKYATN